MTIFELLEQGAVLPFAGGVIDSSTDVSRPLVVVNPTRLSVDVRTSEPVHLAVVYTESRTSSVEITLAEQAHVSLSEIYLAKTLSAVEIRQQRASECHILSAVLCGANTSYKIGLLGDHCASELDAVAVATGDEHATVAVETRHEVADCRSRSWVKCVASGRSTGEFRGLVYVAPDAQRTDAEQQNRNIELDGARIVATPQLEIYADDVRCSHGSTVGYADAEAIFYMRQRGLSEADARRLQIEGFVRDVVGRCRTAPICALLDERVVEKLSEI